MIRVLIISCASRDDDPRARAFFRCVNSALKSLGGSFHFSVTAVSHGGLADFVPQPSIPISKENVAQHNATKLFDALDLVFAYATPTFLPWANKRATNVLRFIRNVLVAKKCLLGSGAIMQLVAYLVQTDGAFIGTCIKPTKETRSGVGPPPTSRSDGSMHLDSTTGELFAWQAARGRWAPVANVGCHKASGHPFAPYHAGLEYPAYMPTSMRLYKHAIGHFIFDSGCVEISMPCRNRWHCHLVEVGAPTCLGPPRPLLQGPTGTMGLEVANVIALQFELDNPQGLDMIRRFARTKATLLSAGGPAEFPRPVELARMVAESGSGRLSADQMAVLKDLAPGGQDIRPALLRVRSLQPRAGHVKPLEEDSGPEAPEVRLRPASAVSYLRHKQNAARGTMASSGQARNSSTSSAWRRSPAGTSSTTFLRHGIDARIPAPQPSGRPFTAWRKHSQREYEPGTVQASGPYMGTWDAWQTEERQKRAASIHAQPFRF